MKSVLLLSGGVGGARLARGLAALDDIELTTVVNVGDDDVVYGIHVSPDLDTVLYTIGQVEGPEGWGIGGDSFSVMERLSLYEVDTSFRIGDRDLATHLFRTEQLLKSATLAQVTSRIADALGVGCSVLPASNDPIRTRIQTSAGEWLSFQEYFVLRGHQDEVVDLRFEGAAQATPTVGVLEAIGRADAVVIGPSNPPLSIWPILAVPGVADAVGAARRVLAVSPLFSGKALKGPADSVMRSLGLPEGNAGVLAAYVGLLHDLVIDVGDAHERSSLAQSGVRVHVADTRIADPGASRSFADWLTGLL